MEAANRLIENGRSVVPTATYDDDVQVARPLRLLCCIGGVATAAVSLFGLLNIFSLLFAPISYLLQAYLLFFGVCIAVLEARFTIFLPYVAAFKDLLTVWAKFITVLGGRGVVYVFLGLVQLSLWMTCFFQAIVGIYLVGVGALCILNHAVIVKRQASILSSGEPPHIRDGAYGGVPHMMPPPPYPPSGTPNGVVPVMTGYPPYGY